MVLADGSFVTASAQDHADLFWAVRGGGGNFGIVTSFLYQLHPISTVYGGPMFRPIEQAADIMKFWRDFILDAPEEINGWFAFLTMPPAPLFPAQFHLQKMCGSCGATAAIWTRPKSYSKNQNLLTEWHIRYRGPGIMIYWHVERKSTCIYSQLKSCSSSFVCFHG